MGKNEWWKQDPATEEPSDKERYAQYNETPTLYTTEKRNPVERHAGKWLAFGLLVALGFALARNACVVSGGAPSIMMLTVGMSIAWALVITGIVGYALRYNLKKRREK